MEFKPSNLFPPVFLPLVAVQGDRLLFTLDDETQLFCQTEDLERFWTGNAFIPWRNFWAISGNIPTTSGKDAIMALKLLLRKIGYSEIPLSYNYDGRTQKTVMKIQNESGIPVDGIVGAMTKIVQRDSFSGEIVIHCIEEGVCSRVHIEDVEVLVY